jgi:hypothetical protein
MKLLGLLLAALSTHASAATGPYVNFIRQTQQGTGVVWDMPVARSGMGPSAMTLETNGSLFQLWTIEQNQAKDYLLDQKLVSAYLPKADIKITTLDPYTLVTRTRVDQPFSVEIEVADLLTGIGLPDAATKVLLEHHVQSYAEGQISLDRTAVAATTPHYSAYISENGKTVLKFAASSLKAADPTKASGEEHFIIHALSDGTITQTQIASTHVQVWPVASGEILGITEGQELRFDIPKIQLNLNDLYPRSDTYLMLYEGTAVNGAQGVIAKAFPVDRDQTVSKILEVTDLGTKFTKNGTYTVALMSETVFGTELLCPPITFSVDRTITINAMQTNFTDDTADLAAP